jgi:hypothetical protein
MYFGHITYVNYHDQLVETVHRPGVTFVGLWFGTEIHAGLICTEIAFIDSAANDDEYRIVALHLMKPSGGVKQGLIKNLNVVG